MAIPDALLYLEWADAPGQARGFPEYFISKGADTETLALTALSKLRPLQVLDLKTFLMTHDRFPHLGFEARRSGARGWSNDALTSTKAHENVPAQEANGQADLVRSGNPAGEEVARRSPLRETSR